MYSGLLFMLAAIILACAYNISMIFIGRVFQGIAVSPCVCVNSYAVAAKLVKLIETSCRSPLPACLCRSTTLRYACARCLHWHAALGCICYILLIAIMEVSSNLLYPAHACLHEYHVMTHLWQSVW